jgi:methylenetetrahydrofolate reductase (NADPH)
MNLRANAKPIMSNEIVEPSASAPSLQEMVAGFSVEISARDPKSIDALPDCIKRGSDVYIPWISGDTHHRIVDLAARLRAAGMNPVPHIAARHLRTYTELSDYIRRARGEADVRQVLLVGGDAQRPAGPFSASLEILETGLLTKNAIARVGFAGHPEGHARVDNSTMIDALSVKLHRARALGLSPHVVTQFCFEAGPILSWARGIRGVVADDVEVKVGLAGPASLTTLMKFALRCGVGNSIKALGLRGPAIARLLSEANPGRVVSDIVAAQAREPVPGFAGFHFFPFGGLQRLNNWLEGARG